MVKGNSYQQYSFVTYHFQSHGSLVEIKKISLGSNKGLTIISAQQTRRDLHFAAGKQEYKNTEYLIATI